MWRRIGAKMSTKPSWTPRLQCLRRRMAPSSSSGVFGRASWRSRSRWVATTRSGPSQRLSCRQRSEACSRCGGQLQRQAKAGSSRRRCRARRLRRLPLPLRAPPLPPLQAARGEQLLRKAARPPAGRPRRQVELPPLLLRRPLLPLLAEKRRRRADRLPSTCGQRRSLRTWWFWRRMAWTATLWCCRTVLYSFAASYRWMSSSASLTL
mmetsp:Transcript_46840/g.111457  ORF Transcript_46840/g.111457 Transcript_46840/m.111457 type:complete len:208 (-) Transcript_46840:801-1424(-)